MLLAAAAMDGEMSMHVGNLWKSIGIGSMGKTGIGTGAI